MDESARNLYEIQMERFEVFKAQDPAHDDFDVVFEIDGKKLYSTKFMLCSISPTMKAMLSERWTKPNEPVLIKDYTFDDFKQFITFIYSGTCELTNDNIFAMIDIAEFYGVKVFKKSCEKFLTKTVMDFNNIYQMMELASKYSLIILKQFIDELISKNLSRFIYCREFGSLDKSVVIDIVKSNQNTRAQLMEEIFDAVYKWSKNHALQKQNADNTLDMNELIKDELTDFFPFIKFEKMTSEFFTRFIAKMPFLFSGRELKFGLRLRLERLVKVTDEHGKIIWGELKCPEIKKVFAAIRSLKNVYSKFIDKCYVYWNTKTEKPTKPSKVKGNHNFSCKWYLIYNYYGDLAVKRCDDLMDCDYLLAEMYDEDDLEYDPSCEYNYFQLSDKCKIDVFSFP